MFIEIFTTARRKRRLYSAGWLFVSFFLFVIFGEAYVGRELLIRLEKGRKETADTAARLRENIQMVEELKNKIVFLSARTDDIEKAAAEKISGFDDQLKIQEERRLVLSEELAREQQARALASAKQELKERQAAERLSALESDVSVVEKTLDSIELAPELEKIVTAWRPRLVQLRCRFGRQTAMGSGVIMNFSDLPKGTVGILTSRHILVDDFSRQTTACDVLTPGKGVIASVSSDNGEIEAAAVGEDVGRVIIRSLVEPFISVAASSLSVCEEKASIGDELLIMGYPGIGAFQDLTVTEGIVSGREGNFYITSAKVERGNSGGAAVRVRKSCFLGIPTFVKTGGIESLARILDISVVER